MSNRMKRITKWTIVLVGKTRSYTHLQEMFCEKMHLWRLWTSVGENASLETMDVRRKKYLKFMWLKGSMYLHPTQLIKSNYLRFPLLAQDWFI